MARIMRIGEPENASEAKAVKVLAAQLPDDYWVIHNFEVTTGRGLPYEYDVVVVGDTLVTHVEVKGYRGRIRGDVRQWIFDNGAVYPSPIPLANKKSKVLKGHLIKESRRLKDVYVDTLVLLTDDRAKAELRDDQSRRVMNLERAVKHLTDAEDVPVRTFNISDLHPRICEALGGQNPAKPVKHIGLYEILERIGQTDERTVFLAKHRFIHTRPQTVLKVFHYNIYASKKEQEREIESIFHDQEAMRLLGAHPHIIETGDMFAWDDNKFVLPTEYVEHAKTLELLLDQRELFGALTWAHKRRVIASVANALQHVHKAGIVHRDVRPLSVVVTPDCETVKLVNFDLAHIRSAPHVADPRNLQKRLDARYTAPEVWRAPNEATPASDVFSLGVLFYELLLHECPFASVDEVIEAGGVTLDKDALLAELGSPNSKDFMSSPEDVVGVIERMCALDPADRYTDMAEVMEDLEILAL
jgi:tRNA A-37 threonylcarbamoyl transferase component Bud32